MTPTETPAKTTNGHISQAVPLATPAASGDAEEREIPLSEIDPDPDQPRKYFSESEELALVDSLATHGQQIAGSAYRNPETGRYRLIDGERRWRAIRRLGWKTMRLRVFKEPPDKFKRSQLQLVSFDQHKDLTLVERDIAYEDHITLVGATATALAKTVGKSVSTVTRAIQRAQSIAPALKERFRAGTLPPDILQELLTLSGDAQLAIAKQYPNPLRNKADVKAAIKAAKKGQAAAPDVFTCDEEGCKIAVTVLPGGNLTTVQTALKVVLEDLRKHGQRGMEHWQTFLAKKKTHAKKAAALAAAQSELAPARRRRRQRRQLTQPAGPYPENQPLERNLVTHEKEGTPDEPGRPRTGHPTTPTSRRGGGPVAPRTALARARAASTIPSGSASTHGIANNALPAGCSAMCPPTNRATHYLLPST